MTAVRRALLLAGMVAALGSSGCGMFYNLQPHRLQQMNRGPGMPTGPEAYSLVVNPAVTC